VDPAGGVESETIIRMRDTLVHRGPDDAGHWIAPDGTVGLGHRRLSILDLSPLGRQPMSDRQGRVQVVYNGEIYNFQSLRSELETLGFEFRSTSDTEVIVNAYLAWGIDCACRFEGMFAFALYDASEGTTFLVRDRLGIKPLFYSQAAGRLVFGSEIRAVLASGRVPAELSPEAAWDYFTYGYVPTPATIYKDVWKLPPACILKYQRGRPVLSRYWEPTFESLDQDSSVAERRLRELVDQSVEAYLVADVPTGAYLSGGLDSSIVVQQAARAFADRRCPRLGGEEFCTFSIGFDVAEHSELHYARDAARMYGTVHAEQVVTREMAHEFGETIVELFDEPFAASSTIPMLFVARLARQKVTVALCGEGGDEAFGGYSWYRWWMRFQRPSFWRTSAGRGARRVLETIIRRPKRKWRLPALEPVELYAQLMGATARADKRRIFSADLSAAMADRDEAAYFRRFWREDLPPMARMQYVDMMTFLPDLNLARADRTSMHFSLELRVPLLNHRLLDYVCALPQAVRNPEGQLKGLYKRAMLQRLPESVRTRKKKGFSSPVKQWFTPEDLAALVRDVRAEHGDLVRTWFCDGLESFARRLEGSRAYKLWVFLKWLRARGA